jgi:MFS family permease
MPGLDIDPRRVLLPISIGTGLSLLGDTTLYTVLPTRTEEAGILLASVGVLLSANRWVRLPLNGAAGWWFERLPRRPVFVGALALGALTTGMYALDAGYANLLAARLLWGLAWIGIWIGGTTLVFDVTDEKDRGRWIGVYQISFFVGAGVGSIAGGLLTDLLGYHGAMAVNALLQLAGALYAWAALPETRSQALHRAREEAVVSAGEQTPPARNRLELTSAVGLLAANRLVQEGVLLASLALYLEGLFGNSVRVGSWSFGTATLTGVGLGLTTLVAAAAAPLSGALSDRRGNRWTVAAISLLPGAIGFAVLRLETPVWIFLGLVGTSIASGGSTNIATSLIGDLGIRSRQGRRLGGLFTVGDLASAVGPLLVFGLAPTVGISGLYAFSAGVFAFCAFVALMWGRSKAIGGRFAQNKT